MLAAVESHLRDQLLYQRRGDVSAESVAISHRESQICQCVEQSSSLEGRPFYHGSEAVKQQRGAVELLVVNVEHFNNMLLRLTGDSNFLPCAALIACRDQGAVVFHRRLGTESGEYEAYIGNIAVRVSSPTSQQEVRFCLQFDESTIVSESRKIR